MVSGNTKSCGCLATEGRKARRISSCHSEITAVLLGYKRHAESRGIAWALSRAEVEGLIIKSCNYCGGQPGNVKKTKSSIGAGMKYSGIDRVDSARGYTKDNVVPACKACNFAKSDMTLDEFVVWAKRLGAMAAQWG